MDRIEITLGDFLKNAGIVGMKYLLEHSDAREGEHYGIEPQYLWISQNYALSANWTDMYFKAFVHYMGPTTVYQTALKKLGDNLEKLKSGDFEVQKEGKEDLKFINDKLLSNSYQSGFENIKDKIEKPEVYQELKSDKLKEKMEPEELIKRMQELKEFLKQPRCKETFCMKSIIYNYINRFWGGKCFLLRANAKKNMREVFEEDFSKQFISYLKNDHTKDKDFCIECSMPMGVKEKVSITFMKDIADDLSRKKSAFWNYKVDAYLCPVCAFLYALVPLGFQLVGNKFIFINTNEDVEVLLSSNKKAGKIQEESKKEDDETYASWFARLMNLVLSEKVKELTNVQVILRGTGEKDRYAFSILHKDILTIFKDDAIRKNLSRLGKRPFVKEGSSFFNVHERAVMNILEYKNQYTLINQILRLSIEQEGVLPSAFTLYQLQIRINNIRKNSEGGKKIMAIYMEMVQKGFALRTELLKKKGADLSDDSSLRGAIYQLINTLSVGNKHKFMEIVLRLYCSCQKPMPEGFVWLLGEEEKFLDNGYAFILGLKGSYKEKETVENKAADK